MFLDESDLSRVNDDEVREAVQRRIVILFILRSTMKLGVKSFFLLVLKKKTSRGVRADTKPHVTRTGNLCHDTELARNILSS